MTSQELKARAYDLLAVIERAQLELRQVNQAIGEALEAEKKPKEEPKAE